MICACQTATVIVLLLLQYNYCLRGIQQRMTASRRGGSKGGRLAGRALPHSQRPALTGPTPTEMLGECNWAFEKKI